MRSLLLSLAVLVLTGVTAQAENTGLQPLETGPDVRGWEAVGRLDIDGKGFCTGALIAPDIVLTAAHCMYDGASGVPVDPSRIRFLAGLRSGQSEAERAIRAAAVHPSYVNRHPASHQKVRYDVALLQLDRPINSAHLEPFEVSTSIRRGSEISVVSYGLGREEAPSLQETCNVLGLQAGVFILDCDVTFGASGSPVFRMENGTVRLVSVISAMAQVNGETVALGMDLAEPIAVLRLALSEGRGLFAQPHASTQAIHPNETTGAVVLNP